MVRRAALLVLLVAATACGGSSNSVTSPTTVSGVPVTPLHGSMTASIDGSAWTATAINTATYTNGVLSIGGADSSSPIRAIGLGVTAGGPGTFVMGALPGAANAVLTIGTGVTWTANILGGSGTLTITALSATSASGTFTFTAVPAAGGATGNHVVTVGVFNITF